MRQFFFSTPSNQASDEKKLSIQLTDDGEITIQAVDETLSFDEKNKPVFGNTTGELVVEYSGLATDGNITRSWAKATFQPDGISQLHYHNERAENYYIVEGRARVTLNDIPHELSAGGTITVPSGVRHQVQNITANYGLLVLIVKCEPAWTVADLHFIDPPSVTHRF